MPAPRPKTQDPITVIQASAAKELEKADKAATKTLFILTLIVLFLAHFITHLVVARDGIPGYFASWARFFQRIPDQPWIAFLFLLALTSIYYGIHVWRHRNDLEEIVLPPYSPVPDLRFTNDIYIGSGYTVDGKQPGDVLKPGEKILENPHLILKEQGLFGNLHVKGATGSGKTSHFIYPWLDQGIMKFPKPHPPSFFQKDASGRYLPVSPPGPEDDPFDLDRWNPYVGMTDEEAWAEYERLLDEHKRKKWAFFIIDAKGDMTRAVMQMAKASNRLEDVIVLRPDNKWTYNPLSISANPLVMAEMVMDSTEAVDGASIPPFWRTTQSEWLANALTLLQAVDPSRVNYKSIVTMARKEEVRIKMVQEAMARMRAYQEEEERCRRLGRPYNGPRINPSAIEFFQDWDSVDQDPAKKRAIVAALKANSKFFIDDQMAPFLCPEMPPTFPGFKHMIDKGLIVVLQMPLEQYGSVGRVLGIMLLTDVQKAILTRLNPNDPINKERIVALVIDECSFYLNEETKNFIAVSRQARSVGVFSHQTQGQIVMEGDRSFEIAFNDNLRTKISFAAPNAEAGQRESRLFGTRKVIKEVYSESWSGQRMVAQEGGQVLVSKGGESRGASVSMREEHEAWFDADAFVTGLKTGQCVVSHFDGERTHHPRKIQAIKYWETPRGRHVFSLEVEEEWRRPHPILFVTGAPSDTGYLNTALTHTGVAFVGLVRDQQNTPRALRFVTDAGTVIVPLDFIQEDQEYYITISSRLSDTQCVVVPIDFAESANILIYECGVRFERVLPMPESLKQRIGTEENTFGKILGLSTDQLTTFDDLLRETVGHPPFATGTGGWEILSTLQTDDSVRNALEEDSRRWLQLYAKIGDALDSIGEEAAEDLFDEMRLQLEQAARRVRLGETDGDAEVQNDVEMAGSPASPTPSNEETNIHDEGDPEIDELSKLVASEPKSKRKKTRSTTAENSSNRPKNTRKRSRSGLQPLFDIDQLNQFIIPNPFDEPIPLADESPATNSSHPHDRSANGRDDAGSDRVPSVEDTDSIHSDNPFDVRLEEDLETNSPWMAQEDDTPDDDSLYS